MRKKYQVFLGIGAIGGVLIYLFLSSFSGTTVYYYTLDELKDKQIDPAERIRISGELVKDSVRYDSAKPLLEFVLQSKDGTTRVSVSYQDVMPDNFMKSEEVVVTGYLEGDRFTAESMLVKCPSKYEAEPEEP
ncbi:MAG: cytochrome c maturation protein CcmE [Candidatus Bipolaricaulia bacterium]